MKTEFLKELGLEKEVIDKIFTENGKDVEAEKAKAEKIKIDFEQLKTEKEALNDRLTERDTQLEDLKKTAGSADELQKQIEALQADNRAKEETHAAEITQLKINNSVKEAITAAGGKNAKAISALLELENAELTEDGQVKGLTEQIKKLQSAEDAKFLFNNNKVTLKGAKVGDPSDPSDPQVDFSKMSYEQICEQMESNPNAE
ncbi:MAG: phage scaffolding protein [Anaerovoracaceae bacterium]